MIAADAMDFEDALTELDEIVAALERGGPDLKEALASYGRGASLLGRCQALLDDAERSVALLTGVDDAGQPITAPFDASATTGTSASVPVPVPAPAPPPPSSAPAPSGSIPDAPF